MFHVKHTSTQGWRWPGSAQPGTSYGPQRGARENVSRETYDQLGMAAVGALFHVERRAVRNEELGTVFHVKHRRVSHRRCLGHCSTWNIRRAEFGALVIVSRGTLEGRRRGGLVNVPRGTYGGLR